MARTAASRWLPAPFMFLAASASRFPGTVTLSMVERVKTPNIRIPHLCGKAIEH
jgi:hypothetical protein